MLRQAERFSTQTSMKTKKEKEKQRESTDTMRFLKKNITRGMSHSGSQMLPIVQNAMEIFPLPLVALAGLSFLSNHRSTKIAEQR